MTIWARALISRLAGLSGLMRPGFAGRGRTLTIAGVFALAMAVALGVGLAHGAALPANGTTLFPASKTMTAHWDKTFHWTIDKRVTPATWNLFNGDSGTSDYTVAVTKDGGIDTYYADGQVCVTNGGAADTVDLQIVDHLFVNTGGGFVQVGGDFPVDVSSEPIIPAYDGGTADNIGPPVCYNYTITIPSPVPGATYKDTADITIMNHSGHIGTPFGPSPSATSILPLTPHLINDTINVDDTNGGLGSTNTSKTWTYSKIFTCDADNGSHDNTATIHETGQHAGASVTVNCYDLDPSKTAQTYLTRTSHWSIAKTCDQTSLTLALGESFQVNCTVTSSITGTTDGDWGVSGTITVTNPAPIDATINNITDVISGIGSVPVDCTPVTFPYTLPAGGTLTCSYMTSLPDGTDRTNTATVTQQHYSYDSGGHATPTTTTDSPANASVAFGSAHINYQDLTASVFDNGNLLGAGGPNSFPFTWIVGPYNTCGDRNLVNTASLVTTDTQTTVGPATWPLAVHVPCNLGCTLTIGYWKNHAGFTGNNADMVSSHLPQWLGTSGGLKSVQVTTASQAMTLLGMSGNASNGINKLYAQLLAAKLNIAAGANGSTVASTISAADAFLATHNANDWSSLSKSQQQTVLGWATTLDNYNNGLISGGPGHCSQ